MVLYRRDWASFTEIELNNALIIRSPSNCDFACQVLAGRGRTFPRAKKYHAFHPRLRICFNMQLSSFLVDCSVSPTARGCPEWRMKSTVKMISRCPIDALITDCTSMKTFTQRVTLMCVYCSLCLHIFNVIFLDGFQTHIYVLL